MAATASAGTLEGRGLGASTAAIVKAAWSAPLMAHAAILLSAMVGVAAFIGVHTSFTDDEANIVLQAQAIEAGHWVLPPPVPQVDPTGRYFATENVSITAKGVAPLAKHLVYTSIVAGALRIAGPAGAMGLSIAGCLLAALCSAWLARLYAPGVERTAFWVTGLASPLFFYAFVDTGQTIGAASSAAATALAVVYLRRGQFPSLLGAVATMAIAAFAREEAVIYGVAAGAGLAAVATVRRLPSTRASRVVAVAVSLPAAALVARYIDVLIADRALGGGQAFSQQASSLLGGNSWLDQLRGFVIAAAALGHGTDPFARATPGILLVTVASLALLGLGAMFLRARKAGRLPLALFVLGAGLLVARSAYELRSPVAGLLPAFPLLWVALWAVRRDNFAPPDRSWILSTTVLFTAGVALSVYSDGGGLQWGGRYLLLALPAALPILLDALRHQQLRSNARTVCSVCLVVFSVAATAQVLGTLRATHRAGTIALTELGQAAAAAQPGDGGQPVVLTSSVAVGMLWRAEDEYRILRPPTSEMRQTGAELRKAGFRRILLATQRRKADEAALRGSYRVASVLPPSPSLPGFTVEVLVAV